MRLLAPTLIKWYLYVVFLLDFSHQTLEVFIVDWASQILAEIAFPVQPIGSMGRTVYLPT